MPHTTNKLCFEGRPCREKASFKPTFINRNHRMKIKVDREKCTTAMADIFNSMSLLIVPYNEGRYHWVFFTLNPLTLQQSFYDSVHGQILMYIQCIHASDLTVRMDQKVYRCRQLIVDWTYIRNYDLNASSICSPCWPEEASSGAACSHNRSLSKVDLVSLGEGQKCRANTNGHRSWSDVFSWQEMYWAGKHCCSVWSLQ